ncbi:hypothetical protein EUGRSUZ_F04431 [Eucalyptus grandis]|uniref:Uncharacterized protein n=2 Tax=Eucalyptus grandis TaxID=71139 RepID=A0ACC3KQ34_EUCGR|nr:hypothetical protein EUGRSUZ_F04431 [Eucalyptus grandis]
MKLVLMNALEATVSTSPLVLSDIAIGSLAPAGGALMRIASRVRAAALLAGLGIAQTARVPPIGEGSLRSRSRRSVSHRRGREGRGEREDREAEGISTVALEKDLQRHAELVVWSEASGGPRPARGRLLAPSWQVFFFFT